MSGSARDDTRAGPSTSLALQCTWIASLSFQYGYHISVLNGLLSALSPEFGQFTPYQIGTIVSVFALGGLFGSIIAGTLADRLGRKRASTLAGTLVGLGALLMALASPYIALLVTGRVLIGVGGGIAVVVVPNYLNEIAPPEKKGSIGVLNQLGIVVGIFTGQSASLGLSTSARWKYAFLISTCVATIQVLSSYLMIESPIWLAGKGDLGNNHSESESSRLLHDGSDTEGEPVRTSQAPPQTFLGVFTSPLIRKGLRVVAVIQIAQQASGINAVLFYSTIILGDVLPNMASYIALLITAVNLIMTFPPMYLIDRVGRRSLLLTSVACMSISSLLLSLTVDNHPVLASISIIAFVASFSIGLGPIPFILIPEVVPSASAPTVGSIGLALNWITNYAVANAFVLMKTAIGTSSVMLVFACISAVATFMIAAVYR